MAIDARWFAVFGAAAGAAGNGIVELVKLVVQGRQQRAADRNKRDYDDRMAKDSRDAEAAKRESEEREAAAQREHERRTALRAERTGTIREWREGLAKPHREYLEWSAKQEEESKKPPGGRRALRRPNIVGQVWFQSLRPHLPSRMSRLHSTGDDIECDDDDTHTLVEANQRRGELLD